MEREGERRVRSLPRSSIKYRQKPWVTHSVCLRQPASLSVSFFPPFFLSVSVSTFLLLTLVSLLVSISHTHTPTHTHTHTHPPTHTHTSNINNSPAQTRLFSLTHHEMTFRSYTLSTPQSRLSFISSLASCFLCVSGWNTGRDGESDRWLP